MTAGGEIGPAQSAGGLIDCRMAGELLQSGQYEQVAAALYVAQTHSTQAGDELGAHLLDAARRLCLACRQCQEEARWHRQAHQEAEHREQELREQLYAILELISTGQQPSAMPKREPSSSIPLGIVEPSRTPKRPSLWRRIRTLLGQKPPPGSHSSGPPDTPPERTVQPPIAHADLPPDLPDRSDWEAPSVSSVEEPEEQAVPSLVVYCLGAFRVLQGDRLIADWNGLKGKSIFKYLLARRETPVAKDILMDLFWPDADPESARRNLHQAIYSLRQTLRRGDPDLTHVHFENDCYLLDPQMSIWVDSTEFAEHARTGSRLEAGGQVKEAMAQYGIAESLYQGDYLEEDLYEDWTAVEREHLRRTYCDLTDRLSEHYAHNGEYNAAIALCHKILGRDNCHEPAHRRLMCCYLAQGQRHLAVRQYLTCVEALQEELELGPSEETEALYLRIAHTA